jgi:ferredoxin
MLKYKIEINRVECISCGTCYSLDTEHFESDEEGKAQLVNGQTDEHSSVGNFDDDKIEQAQDAEDSCPVSVITVNKTP